MAKAHKQKQSFLADKQNVALILGFISTGLTLLNMLIENF